MKRFLTILLLVFTGIAITACNKDTGNSQTNSVSDNIEQQIIGKWKLQEVNNGVQYYITFHNNHQISQVFVSPDGHSRLYSGSWGMIGDSLKIEDKRGAYDMVISEMLDSSMILIRSDSMAVVLVRFEDHEGWLPEP